MLPRARTGSGCRFQKPEWFLQNKQNPFAHLDTRVQCSGSGLRDMLKLGFIPSVYQAADLRFRLLKESPPTHEHGG